MKLFVWGVIINMAPLLRKNKIKVYKLNFKPNVFFLFKSYKLFNILINKKSFTLQTWLYHSDLIGGLFAKLLGFNKIYWNIRTSELDFFSTKIKTYVVIKLCALLSKIIPNKIIICSRRSIYEHIKLGYDDNFNLIQNGFSETKINKKKIKDLKRKYKIKNSDFVIGNVARYHPCKNHELLLNLFKGFNNKYPNSKLILAGTNVNYKNEKILRRIKSLNIKNSTILLGRRDDIANIYKLFDLFILTSKTEGFPNVIAEAMLSGVVCCSTDVGDSKEIIKGYGSLINSTNMIKNFKILNKYYKIKYNKKQIWKVTKQRCKKRITQKYSLEKMIKKYSIIWSS